MNFANVSTLILALIFILSSCSKEDEKNSSLLIPDGRWVEQENYYPNFGFYEKKTYEFLFNGNNFSALIDFWNDAGSIECPNSRMFHIIGTYSMTNDSLFLEGFYYENDFITPDKDTCHRINIYKRKIHYQLDENVLIFWPNKINPYGIDSLHRI